MKSKKKYSKKPKEEKLKTDSIEEVKERIKHQKDACNKILKSIHNK